MVKVTLPSVPPPSANRGSKAGGHYYQEVHVTFSV